MLKNSENNLTEEIGLVTPTPVLSRIIAHVWVGMTNIDTTDLVMVQSSTIYHFHAEFIDGNRKYHILCRIYIYPGNILGTYPSA